MVPRTVRTAFLAIVSAVSLLTAAPQNSNVAATPYGTWFVCEGPGAALNLSFCAGFKPGKEQYLLLYRFISTAQKAEYTIIAKRYDGQVLTRTKVFDRADSPTGYTSVIFGFGGPVRITDIMVSELTVSASQALNYPAIEAR